MKILLVEDHTDLAENITNYLAKERYECICASTKKQALTLLQKEDFDLILLDLTLPDGTGLDVLSNIKEQKPNTQVIIISAQNSLDYKLIGLNNGADDYITKPFPLPELHARIKAVTRRNQNNKESAVLEFNEITINLDSMQFFVNGKELILTKKEINLLVYFINNKNRVLSRQAIATHLWGDYTFNLDNVDFIYQHLKNLRKKIKDNGGNDYLKTIYGLGYKWSN